MCDSVCVCVCVTVCVTACVCVSVRDSVCDSVEWVQLCVHACNTNIHFTSSLQLLTLLILCIDVFDVQVSNICPMQPGSGALTPTDVHLTITQN